MIRSRAVLHWALAAALLLCLISIRAAFAHGDMDSTDPAPDSVVKEVPEHLYINFTETPSKGASVKLLDGCQRDVLDEIEIVERTMHIYSVDSAQPGRWEVRYKIISTEDGHPSSGGYSFRVKGKKDCSEPDQEGGSEGASSDEPATSGDVSGQETAGAEDPGSTSVVVIAALGTLALLGATLMIRRGNRPT
jgi:copper resistance protein C